MQWVHVYSGCPFALDARHLLSMNECKSWRLIFLCHVAYRHLLFAMFFDIFHLNFRSATVAAIFSQVEQQLQVV